MKQPKPEGISLGSIHKMNDRVIICTELWWDNWNLAKVAFYEPATDKVNECDYDELMDMINEGFLELHTPQRGRMLTHIQEEHEPIAPITPEPEPKSETPSLPAPFQKKKELVEQLGMF